RRSASWPGSSTERKFGQRPTGQPISPLCRPCLPHGRLRMMQAVNEPNDVSNAGSPMPNPTELIRADAAVRRLRAALERGDRHGWRDAAEQPLTVALLVEAEERLARLRGTQPWHDLDELRQRLRELVRGSDGGLADL